MISLIKRWVAAAGVSVAVLAGLAAPAQAATCDDACKMAAARSYLTSATPEGDPASVPLADDAIRIENGLVTGRSGNSIRSSLVFFKKVGAVVAVRDLKMSVKGDVVSTTYKIDMGVAGHRAITGKAVEDFTVTDGKISRMVVTLSLLPPWRH